MNTTANNTLIPALTLPPVPAAGFQAQAAGAESGDREKFTELMRVSFDRLNSGEKSKEEQVREAANQLVSVAFIKPMMAQMRQSPFKTEMFGGGPGEAMFQEHMDTVLADRIATRTNYSIADAIYRRIAVGSGMNPGLNPGAGNAPPRLNQHG